MKSAKAMAPLVAANDVKALAALWRGYATLKVDDGSWRQCARRRS